MNNYCLLIGRIANDIEMRQTESGKPVTQISLAITRPFKNPQSNGYDVDFIKVTLWEHIAVNTSEYCKKGDLVGVKGRITTRKETFDNDLTVYMPEIIAERIMFLSSAKTIENKEGQ